MIYNRAAKKIIGKNNTGQKVGKKWKKSQKNKMEPKSIYYIDCLNLKLPSIEQPLPNIQWYRVLESIKNPGLKDNRISRCYTKDSLHLFCVSSLIRQTLEFLMSSPVMILTLRSIISAFRHHVISYYFMSVKISLTSSTFINYGITRTIALLSFIPNS